MPFMNWYSYGMACLLTHTLKELYDIASSRPVVAPHYLKSAYMVKKQTEVV